jgi:hypothetical protein
MKTDNFYRVEIRAYVEAPDKQLALAAVWENIKNNPNIIYKDFEQFSQSVKVEVLIGAQNE